MLLILLLLSTELTDSHELLHARGGRAKLRELRKTVLLELFTTLLLAAHELLHALSELILRAELALLTLRTAELALLLLLLTVEHVVASGRGGDYFGQVVVSVVSVEFGRNGDDLGLAEAGSVQLLLLLLLLDELLLLLLLLLLEDGVGLLHLLHLMGQLLDETLLLLELLLQLHLLGDRG